MDRDVQTEETDTSQKWTQHPPESGGACGGREDAASCVNGAGSTPELFLLTDPDLPWEAPSKALGDADFDSRRLASFLRSASQVREEGLLEWAEPVLTLVVGGVSSLWQQGDGGPPGGRAGREGIPKEARFHGGRHVLQRRTLAAQHRDSLPSRWVRRPAGSSPASRLPT